TVRYTPRCCCRRLYQLQVEPPLPRASGAPQLNDIDVVLGPTLGAAARDGVSVVDGERPTALDAKPHQTQHPGRGFVHGADRATAGPAVHRCPRPPVELGHGCRHSTTTVSGRNVREPRPGGSNRTVIKV